MTRSLRGPLALVGALVAPCFPGTASAQVRDTPVVTLDGAKTAVAAAEAEANRNGWQVAIAVVDPAGELILFHRLDGTQPASIDVAIAKARTAARLRRPTKALDDAVSGGRTALLAIEDVLPLEGGVPIMVNDQVAGAIGASGATSQQDAQVAQAGVAAVQR